VAGLSAVECGTEGGIVKLWDEYRVWKRERFPRGLHVMGTTVCNAKCAFCLYPLKERSAQVLPMETFRRVVDEFAAYKIPFEIGLTPAFADPLMDPFLLDRLAYLKMVPQVRYIHFNTNLIAAERVGFERILRSGVHRIHVSIGGLCRESYKRLFGVDAFDRVFGTLTDILRLNRDLGFPVKFDAIVRADEPFDVVCQKPTYRLLKDSQLQCKFDLSVENEYDDWGGQVDLAKANLKQVTPVPVATRPCFNIYHALSLETDGSFSLCACKDVRQTSLNIRGTLKDALDHRRETIARWKAGDIPLICQQCHVYQDPLLRI